MLIWRYSRLGVLGPYLVDFTLGEYRIGRRSGPTGYFPTLHDHRHLWKTFYRNRTLRSSSTDTIKWNFGWKCSQKSCFPLTWPFENEWFWVCLRPDLTVFSFWTVPIGRLSDTTDYFTNLNNHKDPWEVENYCSGQVLRMQNQKNRQFGLWRFKLMGWCRSIFRWNQPTLNGSKGWSEDDFMLESHRNIQINC